MLTVQPLNPQTNVQTNNDVQKMIILTFFYKRFIW